MDDSGHQAQHATRPLELNQRRPAIGEPVENFRMDWVGRLQALFIVAIAAFRRELLMLRAIEVRESPCDHIPILELGGIDHWFEQATPDDLKSFLGACWPPRGFNTA